MVTMTASDTQSKTAKKARWNKNKKKNWRKKIDISDVEDKLDKERLELRTGGLVKNKSDQELFVIEKNIKNITKRIRQEKRLMVDKIILPDPKLVKPASQRNSAKLRRRQQRLNLMNLLGTDKHSKVLDTSKSLKASKHNDLDLWSKPADQVLGSVFEKSDVTKYTESIIGKAQLQRPKHLYKAPSTKVKSVEVAHAGASYNPTFEDHQDLLFDEYGKEINKIKEEERIERSVMVDADTIATADSLEKELKEGLFDGTDCENDSSEDEESNSVDGKINAEVAKPVTRKKRKLQSQQQMKEVEKHIEWADKLRENEVYRVKTFLNEIKEKEKRIELKKQRKLQRHRQPVLSYSKFQDADQDFKLSSEMHGSLRQLKPEGNLLVDRYKSLQKRCIVEPRQRFRPPKRKYRVKYQEKRSFREIEL